MNFGVRTILLLAAVVLFVLGVFMDEGNFDELLFLGLAAFAGAFLSDALGYADRTFGNTAERRDTT
jgi:membrane protein DedA with SNARE-associated domain